MTASDVLPLLFAAVAGISLGVMFFGGLYWTVRKGLSSPSPVLWFFASLGVRMGLALTGFYFVSNGHWQQLVACLLGFLVSRLVVTRLTRPLGQETAETASARHAP